MALTEPQIAHLVAALLTVNLYPLDRAAALMPAFKERGLLDPARVGMLKQEELAEAMRGAGYARGGFVPIVSFRLYPLMEALAAGQLDGLPAAVEAGDRAQFEALLCAIHGFGPTTSAAAWSLWTGDA